MLSEEAPVDSKSAANSAPVPAAEKPAEAVPEQSAVVPTEKPAEETEVKDGAEETQPEAPKTEFSAHLPSSTADEEARKRAERAKRFGISEENDEEKKKAERAQRFGVDQSSLTQSLDSALPEKRRPKRGHEGGDGGERNAKRQQGGGRHRGNRRGRGGRGGPPGRHGGQGEGRRDGRPQGKILDNPSERAKAEARAKRFGA